MGFFDNLSKKASAAYDATAEKTGKLAKEAKLRMKINENKSDINDLYKEIGRKVYEKHVREENIDIKSELEEECTKIDVLSAEIETCLKSILELKDKRQCEKCHAEIETKNAFCPKCGAKQPGAEVLNAEVVKHDLANSEIEPDNQEEARIVEEEVSGESVVEETPTKETVTENDLERVTEVMAVETQEESKKENE
ncbi:MAG: zinc-ribbon domain-containing protein [Clostridia bacterium]|nr:zinc-ribbon domain-containing protein [Clostridia bacterium]